MDMPHTSGNRLIPDRNCKHFGLKSLSSACRTGYFAHKCFVSFLHGIGLSFVITSFKSGYNAFEFRFEKTAAVISFVLNMNSLFRPYRKE